MGKGKRLIRRTKNLLSLFPSGVLVLNTSSNLNAETFHDVICWKPLADVNFQSGSITLSTSKMCSGFFLILTLSLYVFTTSALPSGPRASSIGTRKPTITIPSSIETTPEPYPAYPVRCLNLPLAPTVTPADCGSLLNDNILELPDVFKKRAFFNRSYKTDAGGHARARWWYGSCEVSVEGHGSDTLMLSFFDVALMANKVVYECVQGVRGSKGGLSLIGDPNNVYVLTLHAFNRFSGVSAEIFNISHQPAASLSKRAVGSQAEPESAGAPQGVETSDLATGVSRLSDHPAVAPNVTLPARAPTTYPVHCLGPLNTHLQPTAAADCSYIINHVILRLFDPTRPLTFGFTDAADINLSKPEYQRWQRGKCAISVTNNDEGQSDMFSLLDMATTARRIGAKCLVNREAQLGGVASIGTEGRGFLIDVGGPLAVESGLQDTFT